MRYERKVHERLIARYGLSYVPGQWWAYCQNGKVKYCQTDGLLFKDAQRMLVLAEVKYSHTPDAFWQVENTYLPVLRAWLRASPWKIATVEIVKWYDAAVRFPVRPVLRPTLDDVKLGEFAVHILNR